MIRHVGFPQSAHMAATVPRVRHESGRGRSAGPVAKAGQKHKWLATRLSALLTWEVRSRPHRGFCSPPSGASQPHPLRSHIIPRSLSCSVLCKTTKAAALGSPLAQAVSTLHSASRAWAEHSRVPPDPRAPGSARPGRALPACRSSSTTLASPCLLGELTAIAHWRT